MAAPLQYSLLLLPFLCLFLALAFSSGEADPKVPAIFIFGDSSADVGNSKYLSGGQDYYNNFLPYGIDYPSKNARHPTGRYSNGYNGADALAQIMGFKESPPPFRSLLIDNNTCEIDITQAMKGLNFASGGSRLLTESSDGVISMTEQVKCFRKFRSQLTTPYPLLSESLFLISIGDNDIGAFLSETYHKRNDTDFNIFIETASFISNLTATYRNHIMDLYELGGRKFGIVNFVPVGYIPRANVVSRNDTNVLNILPWLCNIALKVLMNNLSSTLPGMKYSIGNSYAVFMKIIDNPGAYGFKNVTDPCCGSALYGCNQTATVCSDRSQYLFWDNVHPTMATAEVFGNLVYDGSTEFASPINFKKLVEDYNELTSVY
ncbi:GDSL esterase/lipase At5g63170-like [Dioscorea cayenensis subsp. rotundata]|uniref:GDSL esterase/lipase At5g63170-like n=1 Tax=Dioscorea cayennensis subsp. rotundata TaxID=55577 RepID=A0AB40AZ62_DIOCR|nr:GDSL esterase/lipase At5g63170-like [Dioscorea cayenensis subsp. rotundata]